MAVLPKYCTDRLINGRLEQSNILLSLISLTYPASYCEFSWSQIKSSPVEKKEYSFCYVIFHKLSFVNVNSLPLAAVQEEAHFLGCFFLSLSLNSDSFSVEPKKNQLLLKMPKQTEECIVPC